MWLTADFVLCQSSSCRETSLSIRCQWRSSRKQLGLCWRCKESRPLTMGTFRKQQVKQQQQGAAAGVAGMDGDRLESNEDA